MIWHEASTNAPLRPLCFCCSRERTLEVRINRVTKLKPGSKHQSSWFGNTYLPESFSTAALPHSANMLGLGAMQPRQLAAQILNFALVLSTAFMLWKGLSIAADSPSPIVVVLSGSMEPAFERGDLLILWNRGMDTQIGEIVVYNVKGKPIPIVHRVVRRYGGG